MVLKLPIVLIVSLAGGGGPPAEVVCWSAARERGASRPSSNSPPPITAPCLRNVRRYDFVFMKWFLRGICTQVSTSPAEAAKYSLQRQALSVQLSATARWSPVLG